ncbi:MAG: hypothetical protein Q7R76_02020 [Candidatus Woesearchaeota archaeon]|nr:hypothetical protein [Candidatus Woesearchaeota archaeon]
MSRHYHKHHTNKKGQAWLETLAVAFEVFIGGMLILFFINQGVAISKGAQMTSQYLANDLALTMETAAGMRAEKMVLNYSHRDMKVYKIAVADTVSVEKITGIETSIQQIIQIPSMVYTRLSGTAELFVVKLGSKVALVPEPTTVDELVLGSSPVTRIKIVNEGGVVAYEAS